MAPDTDTNSEVDATDAVDVQVRRGRHPHVRHFNGIGFKIMLANTLALLMLGLGVVMFSEYKRSLVFTELSLLEDEARLWARAMVQPGMPDPATLDLTRTRDVVADLAAISSRHAFVFTNDGHLVLQTLGTGPSVHERYADEPKLSFIKPFARFLLLIFPVEFNLPVYPETNGQRIEDYPGAELAPHTNSKMNVWVNNQGQLMFTAAVPIGGPDHRLGTLLLIKDATQTEEAFQMARLDVVRILLAALAITMTMTLYVAFMVARPLNRLARAAEAMRVMKTRKLLIPDLRTRGDEIGALSVVLREGTEALWARMDDIERFAADVAHELKNPLTSLRSALETLPRLDDPAKRQKLMNIMAEDTQRLDRLITDIAKASRLDAELSREAFYPLRLSDVMAQVLRGYAPAEVMMNDALPRRVQTRVRGVVLEVLVPDDLPRVRGNPLRLQQVFDNLISNALSFSPDAASVVVVAEMINPKTVRITVDDQGPGIPEGKLQAIFSRFYSERPNAEEFGTHSGLGLAIAQQIIKAVDGKIYAQNRYDDLGAVRGARFVVELDAAQQDS